jgi:phosphatidylglycerophosphatase A
MTGFPREAVAAAIATGCGLGRVPKAPGTVASLAALVPGWFLAQWLGWPGPLLAGAMLFVAGWWALDVRIRAEGFAPFGADQPYFVIDEIAAMLLVLAAVPANGAGFIMAFAVFRLFDIAKPWPISWADKRVPGGLGIMLDDAIAAVLSALMVSVFALVLGGYG